MIAVVQRVSRASVSISGIIKAQITSGLLILLGIEEEDNQEDISWLAQKLVNLRIFSDDEDKMNLSVKDIQGETLIVSQFTLHASTKKETDLPSSKQPGLKPRYRSMKNLLQLFLLMVFR